MFLAALLLLLLVSQTAARLINVTIDDTYGDARTRSLPTFTAANDSGWIVLSPTSAGEQALDFALVHNGTLCALRGARVIETGGFTVLYVRWYACNSDRTWGSRSGTAGVAIYVFTVFDARMQPGLVAYLDGVRQPTNDGPGTTEVAATGYLYNHMKIANHQLERGTHNLTMDLAPLAEYFDYAVYSTEEETLTEHSQSDPSETTQPGITNGTGALEMPSTTGNGSVAGLGSPAAATPKAAIGASLAVLALVVASSFYMFSRRRRKNRPRWRDALRRVAGRTFPEVHRAQSRSPDSSERSRAADPANIRLQLELEEARAEIQRLRQAAAPPPYSYS
ncbi:hypothetical protein AURDEDRAFT_124002 [Auricularia subglabra TFB-10046 SS5]|nr:hypothetical protein AURDEDRAFT_124002 [Auricularia subglabra TFB-10046 SS5]